MSEQWEAVIAGLDVGLVIQDTDARIVYANPKAEALLGIGLTEMAGSEPADPVWNVITPEGRPVTGSGHPVIRVLETGEAVRDVILGIMQPRTGERAWLMVSALPERDVAGTMRRVIVTLADVSVAQRALRESESIYQSVLRAMSEGVVVHNPDGSIRFANDAAERVLGLTVEQMSGRSPLDPRWRLVKPNGDPPGQMDIPSEITQATGKPCNNVVLGVHRGSTGERGWLSISTDPIRESGSDTTLGVVATFTDITAERETKLELEASRAQVVRVIDALPGAVFQFFRSDSGQDALPFLGGRVEELLGDTAEVLRNDPSRLLLHVHPDDLGRFVDAVDLAVRSGTPISAEIALRRPNERTRWLRVHGIPERQQTGVLYTGVVLDATESHELADALHRTQRREAMADLAAGIAHNFNNMLAVILPNVEMAALASSPETRTLLDDAAGAARSATDLVAQMLTLGRQDLREDETGVADVIALLRETLRICRSTFDRGIAISERITTDAAFVRGNRSQIQQVLLNFCLNARDAVAGRLDARLDVSAETVDGRTVVLEIADNGTGMTPEVIRRLGEPFFTTKMAGRGTGLGVASAFRTIHQSGGEWTVDSTPGRGTRFTIRLPLAPAVDRAETASPATTPVTQQGVVLIVDDEAMVRRALHRQVRAAGFTALEASTGAEALTMLRERGAAGVAEVAVVLLDLSMPGMSGAQVLDHLRVQAPTLPVIVLSGHIADADALVGASAILQKPVTQAQLVNAITVAMAR